ncbi:MAG: ferrochelatase [Candidatus Tectomicrobia bacterium]|nr:ferrochelatase [Candidatus Tectomicrobia bacterium]
MNLQNPQHYDAILLVSFGGPEGMKDVMPFLENVVRGRNIPRDRLESVAEHYYAVDGVSPVNDQNRALIAALKTELDIHGPQLPIYWGNRNWAPYLTDTVQQMADDGIQRALAIFTSAYSSYSSCRQYRENIVEAQKAVGKQAPAIDKIRVFYNHPDFVAIHAKLVNAALQQLPAERRATAHIVFTAHSIPTAMAQNCRYEAQLQEVSRLTATHLNHPDWRLVYQSRSGPPMLPWLEPDICDHLKALKAQGILDVVVAPIGFLSDHMEVIYDLDIEAAELAQKLDMTMIRAGTVGIDAHFVTLLRHLIVERMTANPEILSIGNDGPGPDVCPIDCCLPGRGRPIAAR